MIGPPGYTILSSLDNIGLWYSLSRGFRISWDWDGIERGSRHSLRGYMWACIMTNLTLTRGGLIHGCVLGFIRGSCNAVGDASTFGLVDVCCIDVGTECDGGLPLRGGALG